jgi:hypothetical protein
MQPIDGKPANRKMALFLGLKVALKFEKKNERKIQASPAESHATTRTKKLAALRTLAGDRCCGAL